LEEIWELFLFAVEFRPITRSEAKEAQENCSFCAVSTKETVSCDCCYTNDIDDDNRDCCCAVPCYNYVVDIWNTLDILMIFSGILGLVLHNIAYLSLNTFTIQELWSIALTEQVSNVFMSICVVIAYFRFLNYLIHWEYIGVLVITVFHMMSAIVKFVILFLFVSIGFSAAFHMLYDNTQIYSTFSSSVLRTSIAVFSGYDIPDPKNLLVLPNTTAGYVFQVACVVIGVVLLLNFLIAMMSTIYEGIQDNSTEEYRWSLTRDLTQLKFTAWPVPFLILQIPIGCGAFCCFLCCQKDPEWQKEQSGGPADPDVRRLLYANMAISYFRESLGEAEYKDVLLFDDFDDVEDLVGHRSISKVPSYRNK